MNAFADSLIQWLWRTSAEASLLVALVLVLRKALEHRLTPRWRLALWAAVAIKCLVPAALPTGIGLGLLWDKPMVQSSEVIVVSPTVVQETPVVVAAPVVKAATPSLSTLLLLTWLVGAVAVLAIAARRQFSFQKILQSLRVNQDAELAATVHRLASEIGLKRLPLIRVADSAVVPSVCGLLRPVLILPRVWTVRAEQGAGVEQVLKHELMHLKHHDIWWNWAGVVLQAVHWFNPLVWLAASRCQEDRELACDERVLADARQIDRVAYGRELLRLQETFSAPPALAGLAACVRTHPTLRQRILMITQPVNYRPWLQLACAAALVAIVGLSFGTSARADEDKAATRTREGERTRSAESGEKPRAGREAEGVDGMKKRGGEAEGGKKRGAEGEGSRKAGPRDGEGGAKGTGDGVRKAGPREGDGAKKTGPRDGEGGAKTGARDGEGKRGRGESAERGASAETSDGEKIIVRVINGGNEVSVGKEKMAVNRLRAYFSEFLPEHEGARVVIQADEDVPFKAVAGVLDAARDNGAKNAVIESAPKGEQ